MPLLNLSFITAIGHSRKGRAMRKCVVFALALAMMFLLGASNSSAGIGPVYFQSCECEGECFGGLPGATFGAVIINNSSIEIEVSDAEVGFLSMDYPLYPTGSSNIPAGEGGFFLSDPIYPLPTGTLNITCSDQYVDAAGNVAAIAPLTSTCPIPACDIQVPVDIRPQSCPNPLNPHAKGVLPVAILGTDEFDVAQIDPASVQLAGVAPLRWSLDDVATPFNGIEINGCSACTEEGPDGYMDLTLKFDTHEIVAAIADSEECPFFDLTGNLMEEYGGTPIQGYDTMWVTPSVDGD